MAITVAFLLSAANRTSQQVLRGVRTVRKKLREFYRGALNNERDTRSTLRVDQLL
jgi:hypothetical protein